MLRATSALVHREGLEGKRELEEEPQVGQCKAGASGCCCQGCCPALAGPSSFAAL